MKPLSQSDLAKQIPARDTEIIDVTKEQYDNLQVPCKANKQTANAAGGAVWGAHIRDKASVHRQKIVDIVRISLAVIAAGHICK